MLSVPSGMKPLLEVYGKGKNRFPLLVLMSHPLTWVVQLPSNDVNGEDGTVQAGEYAKGDTATFFLYSDEGHVDNIGKQDKALFERTLIKAISQKGNNMYQDFKVMKATPQTGNPDYAGKDYVLCDFKYTLLTGAGFEVERRGVAAVTSEGPAVEVLWAASTRERCVYNIVLYCIEFYRIVICMLLSILSIFYRNESLFDHDDGGDLIYRLSGGKYMTRGLLACFNPFLKSNKRELTFF